MAPATAPEATQRLLDALTAFDEERAGEELDAAMAARSTDSVARDLVLPVMRRIGERWETGEIGVAEEHFASNLVRGRLLGLARNWGLGEGPVAVLACPPGEQHDLALICFGLALRGRGWRIAYLGPDTPIEEVAAIGRRLSAQAIVVAALDPGRLTQQRASLASVGSTMPLWLGGSGASQPLAGAVGAGLLESDPVAAAIRLADGA